MRSIVITTVCAALFAAPASAQCTQASGLTAFEPNPPGAQRPASLNQFLSISGFYEYQPVGAAPRLLVTELYGYHVVDLSNPANPVALGFDDFRFVGGGAGPIICTGDCHGSIQSMTVSPDGARAMFSLTSLAITSSNLQTAVGAASSNGWGFELSGDLAPSTPTSVALQQLGSRYFAYTFSNAAVRVAEVTTLPVPATPDFPAQNSIAGELATGLSPGYGASIAGHWLTYSDGATIWVVDVSTPLPATALTSSALSVTDFGRVGDRFSAFNATVDPSDREAVFVLAEFATGTNTHRGYTLLRARTGAKTVLGSLTPAPGDAWQATYSSAFGVDSSGNVTALMWLRTAAGAYRLLSSPTWNFGVTTGQFDITDANFRPGHPTVLPGSTAGALFAYIPGASAGWVFALTCAAPAPDGGTNVSDGGVLPRDAGASNDAGSGGLADGGSAPRMDQHGCGCTNTEAVAVIFAALTAALRRRRHIAASRSSLARTASCDNR